MNYLKNIKLTNNITLINKPYKKKEYYHFLKTSDLSLVVAEIKKNVFVLSKTKSIYLKIIEDLKYQNKQCKKQPFQIRI